MFASFAMRLSAFNLCNRIFYKSCVRNRYNLQVRTLCQETKNESKPQKKIMSKQFPGYELVYMHPFVAFCALHNRAKLYGTILLPVSLIGASVLYACDLLSWSYTIAAIISWPVAVCNFHIVGLLFNNLVGLVYFKEETDAIKVSYVTYWGKRADIDVTIPQIIVNNTLSKWYHFKTFGTFTIKSHKRPYVLDLKRGKIINRDIFDQIFEDIVA